ncbi:MAG TPA: hypothetical protein VEO00_01655, partial [Actinomycetota bacterium]|nr:hypothetical protein [Actinomycetota bacterium]
MSLSALVLLSVVVLVPGLGATLALWRPGEVGLPTRMALAAGFGYAIWALIAFALAMLHALRAPVLVPLMAAATAGLWWFGLRRGSLAAHVRAVRDEVRADPWTMVAGLLVLIGLAVVRGTYSSLLDLRGASPFRYWADGLEIADGGRIPDLTLQWGMAMVPTVSKVMLNAFNASASFVLGTNALHALGPLLWLSSVGLATAFWALGRE